jgi:hypothetical protein
LHQVINANQAKPEEVKNDPDYTLRRIFRSYSKAFNTPLHLVEELDLQYVLQHYFEHSFEEMDEQQLQKTLEEAILDPADLEAAQLREDQEDADSFELLKQIAEEEKLKAVANAASNLGKALNGLQEKAIQMGREAELAPTNRMRQKPVEESISMNFDNFDEEGGFGLLTPPKRNL